MVFEAGVESALAVLDESVGMEGEPTAGEHVQISGLVRYAGSEAQGWEDGNGGEGDDFARMDEGGAGVT